MQKAIFSLLGLFCLGAAWLQAQDEMQFPERNCACMRTVADAEVISTEDGQMHGNLSAGTAVRLAAVERNWAKVYYNPGGDLRDCMLAESLLDSGWVERGALPQLAMLAKNFQPKAADGTLLFRTEVRPFLDEGRFEVDFILGEQKIWQGNLSTDHYEPASFDFYYTGSEKYPWLFHYSGQMGDAQMDPGVLILLGPKDSLHFNPDPGNRVTAASLTFGPEGWLTVKEAFHCQVPMMTRWELRDEGLERVSATFSQAVYPKDPADLSDPDYIREARLEHDLNFYLSSDKKEKKSLAAGTVLSLELFEADLEKGLVKGSFNGKYGWIEIEVLKSLRLLSSMWAGACGAG